MKAYSLNPCAPEEESVNFIDNWKEPGIGDKAKPASAALKLASAALKVWS